MRHTLLLPLLLAGFARTAAAQLRIESAPAVPPPTADLHVQVVDERGHEVLLPTRYERLEVLGERRRGNANAGGDGLQLCASPVDAAGQATNVTIFPAHERLPDGRLRVAFEEAGRYAVAVLSDVHAPVERLVEVDLDAPTEVRFQLGPRGPGTELRFGLREPDGSPYRANSRKHLFTVKTGLRVWESYFWRGDGNRHDPESEACHRTRIGPGTYRYRATSRPRTGWHGDVQKSARYAPAEGLITLVAGETTTIAPRLAPGGHLALRVVTPEPFDARALLADSSLPKGLDPEFFFANDGVLATLTRDERTIAPRFDHGPYDRLAQPNGRILRANSVGPWLPGNRRCGTYDALPVGTYHLVVRAGAFVVERDVVIADGETTEVVIELGR